MRSGTSASCAPLCPECKVGLRATDMDGRSDDDGFLSPLFVTEVDVQHTVGNSFLMRHANAGELQLNHHLLRQLHLLPEELRAIQEDLAGEYGSFADRLRTNFETLGLPLPDFNPEQLEPYPRRFNAQQVA